MDQAEAIRVRQAANPSTPPEILWALARDPSVTVRISVALNPALPPPVDAILAEDRDARVRTILSRKLLNLAPKRSDQTRKQVQDDAVAKLTAMVTEAGLRVRISLAEAVRDLPNGPREIVLRLAHDPALTVCEAVIRFSPMLTQEDLVALIASEPPPTTVVAVARRPGIGSAVSDAVVGTSINAAIGALLANPTAQIREATLDALAAQSEEQADWQAPLIRRPRLPPRAQQMLSEIVTGPLLEALAARNDLDPRIARTLAVALGQPNSRQPSSHQPSSHQPSSHQPSQRQPGAGEPSANQPNPNQPSPNQLRPAAGSGVGLDILVQAVHRGAMKSETMVWTPRHRG